MNPAKGMLFFFLFYIMVNSYLLYVVERGSSDRLMACYIEDYDINNRVKNYKDAVWLTIITFLTVGYGDFFPTSNQGRYIMIISVIGGQLYSALVIGLVHSQLNLTSEEAGVPIFVESYSIGSEYHFE